VSFSSPTRHLRGCPTYPAVGFLGMGKDFNFFPKTPSPPYKIANAITTLIANGKQYALMISGKCDYHLMQLPIFRVGSVSSGKGCKE
jgi:hypothetical protein